MQTLNQEKMRQRLPCRTIDDQPANRENPTRRASDPSMEKSPAPLYRVIIHDNDTNTYQQVIDICMIALGVSFQEAYTIALAIDHNGRAEVLHAEEGEARRVAKIIGSIGIDVTVEPVPAGDGF